MKSTTNFRLSGKVAEGQSNSGTRWIKYNQYADDTREVSVGDTVYMNDPDAGAHAGMCELVIEIECVGTVGSIYYFPADDRVTVTTTFSGHIPIEDVEMGIPESPRAGPLYVGTDHPMVEGFENLDYDEYMECLWHAGEEGVGAEVWEHYKDDGCEYCTGGEGSQEIVGR